MTNRLKNNFPIIIVLLIATILRFSGLATRDIWYDEALTVQQSEKTWSQIAGDVPTPVHYYFVKLFLFIGKNTFIVGLPSVLFGIGSVYLVYLLGKKLDNKKIGLITAFLFAISPMAIEFSQQILHYSYFIFLTLLSLNYFVDIILDLKRGRINFKKLFLLLVVTVLNILTHVSSLIVAVMEAFIAFFILLSNKSLIKKYYKPILVLAVLGLASVLLLTKIGSGYYVDLFVNLLNFDTTTPMRLGYSLSWQLGTQLLKFSPQFFISMFGWFGLGKGFPLELYFCLFLLGVYNLARQKKYFNLGFILFWISYPFIQLYFVRPSHWFEEKYFIFIIPVYLFAISYGVLLVSQIIQKTLDNLNFKFNLRKLETLVLVFIFIIALRPIVIRTTFGFPVNKNVEYSWRSVHEFLRGKIGKGDRVFVQRGEGTFFSFYFKTEDKNKVWFEDNYLFPLGFYDYLDFISKNVKNYFATIPDFKDQYISSATEFKNIETRGNFNITQFKFVRNVPIILEPDASGNVRYHDNFNSAKYLKDAMFWEGVKPKYFDRGTGIPDSYNFILGDVKDGIIEYHFKLPNAGTYYLVPEFSINKTLDFKVYAGNLPDNLTLVYNQSSLTPEAFQKVIPLYSSTKDLYIRFELDYKSEEITPIWERTFVSFDFYRYRKEGEDTYERDGDDYIFKSDLEVVKSSDWTYQTIQNYGWNQAFDGSLNNYKGGAEAPLIYLFNFEKNILEANIFVKTYTFNNSYKFYYSTNGLNWVFLEEVSANDYVHRDYLVDGLNTKKLFVKFVCENPGYTCQLRILDFVAK